MFWRAILYSLGGIIILVTNKFMWELMGIGIIVLVGLIPKGKRR